MLVIFRFFIVVPVVLYSALVVCLMAAGLHEVFTGHDGARYFVLSGLALIPPIVVGVASLSAIYGIKDEEE